MQAEALAQRALLDLATIDTQRARLAHRLRSLPETNQLAELNKQRLAAGEAVVAAETALGDLNLELERLESDITPAKQRLERNKQRSTDGSVGDSKALRALLDEIDHLTGRIAKLEDDQLDLMQQVEDQTIELGRIRDARAAIEGRMRDLLGSRDTATAEINAELADLTTERADVAGRIEAPLLALYQKIADRQVTGAAELRARRCSGCSLEVDAASLRRFADASPDEVLRCEECGRILVRTGESGLTK